MVLPRFTSPFRGMRSRYATHLSCPCGTQRTFQHVCWTSLARDAPGWLALDVGIALTAAQARGPEGETQYAATEEACQPHTSTSTAQITGFGVHITQEQHSPFAPRFQLMGRRKNVRKGLDNSGNIEGILNALFSPRPRELSLARP